MGDFNVNYKTPNTDKDFKPIMEMYGFKQLINKPTQTTSMSTSITDLFFTNSSENIANSDVITISLSDHNMIDVIRKINNVKFPTQKV